MPRDYLMKKNSSAFVLIYVIALIGIIGVTMGSLSMGLRMTLTQTNRFHLAAIEHNLSISALAWSQHSLGEPGPGLLQHDADSIQSITLDANSLSTRPCAISIHTSRSDGGTATLHISTSCTYGRTTLEKSHAYIISPENKLSALPRETP